MCQWSLCASICPLEGLARNACSLQGQRCDRNGCRALSDGFLKRICGFTILTLVLCCWEQSNCHLFWFLVMGKLLWESYGDTIASVLLMRFCNKLNYAFPRWALVLKTFLSSQLQPVALVPQLQHLQVLFFGTDHFHWAWASHPVTVVCDTRHAAYDYHTAAEADHL